MYRFDFMKTIDVMIVEDKKADAALLSSMLVSDKDTSCKCRHFGTLKSAIQSIENCVPNIILLDLGLPDSFGIETFRAIKAVAEDTPIIVLTILDDLDIGFQTIKEGAQDYLIKGQYNRDYLRRSAFYGIQRQELINETVKLNTQLAESNDALEREITERRKAEERFKLAVNAAPNAMIMVSEKGKILLTNNQFERAFGYKSSEVVGQPIDVVITPRIVGLQANHILCTGDRTEVPVPVVDEDIYLTRKNGETFPVEIGRYPIEASDGKYVLTSITDITERKRIQKEIDEYARNLERSNIELKQFAYAASHDLKAPLRAITRISEWIAEELEETCSDETRENLGLLRNRASRMSDLINDLIDYSQAGISTQDQIEIGVEELVREAADLLDPSGSFRITTAADMPIFSTNATPFRQVFTNLIENSIKHAEKSTGRIHCDVTEFSNYYQFTVSDDGPGVPEESKERIFDIFYKLQSRDQVEGSGIGLALVRKIVERFGGRIQLLSLPEWSTTFQFDWPKKIDEA